MEASQENIKGLVIRGFKEIKTGVYIFRDITARISGGYLMFKYGKEDLPIIDSLEFVGLMQRGIYSFVYLEKEKSSDETELDKLKFALQCIATGEIVGEPKNYKDSLYVVKQIATEALEKLQE